MTYKEPPEEMPESKDGVCVECGDWFYEEELVDVFERVVCVECLQKNSTLISTGLNDNGQLTFRND